MKKMPAPKPKAAAPIPTSAARCVLASATFVRSMYDMR
jgi:hypothetical protein